MLGGALAWAATDGNGALVQAGASLFQDRGCAHCHGANGEGTAKGPSLQGLAKDKFWTDAKLNDQIVNGGQKMPPFGDSLSDAEAMQLIAYLRAETKPEKGL